MRRASAANVSVGLAVPSVGNTLDSGDEHVRHVMAAAIAVDDGVGGVVAHLRGADDVARTEREADVVSLGGIQFLEQPLVEASGFGHAVADVPTDREVEPGPRDADGVQDVEAGAIRFSGLGSCSINEPKRISLVM